MLFTALIFAVLCILPLAISAFSWLTPVHTRLQFHLKGPCSWFRSKSCVLNQGRAPAPFLRAGHPKPLDGVALAAGWLVGGWERQWILEKTGRRSGWPPPPLFPPTSPSLQPRPLDSGRFGHTGSLREKLGGVPIENTGEDANRCHLNVNHLSPLKSLPSLFMLIIICKAWDIWLKGRSSLNGKRLWGGGEQPNQPPRLMNAVD